MAADRQYRAHRHKGAIELLEKHVLIRPPGNAEDVNVGRVLFARRQSRQFGLQQPTLRLLKAGRAAACSFRDRDARMQRRKRKGAEQKSGHTDKARSRCRSPHGGTERDGKNSRHTIHAKTPTPPYVPANAAAHHYIYSGVKIIQSATTNDMSAGLAAAGSRRVSA